VWEASTNLCTNGGFETNLNGWSAFATASISRILTDHVFGSACMRVDLTTVGAGAQFVGPTGLGLAAGTPVTAQVRFKGTAGQTYEVQSLGTCTDATSFGGITSFVARGGWEPLPRTSSTAVPVGKIGDRVQILIFKRAGAGVNTAGADTFYIDGAQSEPKGFATPYIHTDGATATRAAGRVQAPASLLNATQGWVATRLRVGITPVAGTNTLRLGNWAADASNYLDFHWYNGGWRIDRCALGVSGGTASKTTAHTAGDLVTVIAAWDATHVYISVNGSAFVVAGNTTIPAGMPALFDIGSAPTTFGSFLDGDVLWFACGTGILNDDHALQISQISNSGDSAAWKLYSEVHPVTQVAAVAPFDTATYYTVGPDAVSTPVVLLPGPAAKPEPQGIQWSLVLTDLVGKSRAFPQAWESIEVTRRVGDSCEGHIQLDIYDPTGTEVLIGQRGVKFYRGNTLKLFGTIWEPLSLSNKGGIQIVVKDAYENMKWRRVREQKVYTAQDAAAIALDRLSIQNAIMTTRLRAGSSPASINRTMTVNPGQMEADIIGNNGLAAIFKGYFFLVNPVDAVDNVFSQIDFSYPNAGSTREEVRFEFGEKTRDNLSDYYVEYTLPKNRVTAAGTAPAGGRIVSPYEDAASETTYGLYEDEVAYNNVTDTTLLAQWAQADVRPAPPVTYKLTPNNNSPLLFQDFDAGDFVRLIIKDGPLNVYSWVRVVEATAKVDKNGTETLSAITVETLVGDKPVPTPEDAFRSYLDDIRLRLELLQLQTQSIPISSGATAAAPAPPTTGAGSAPAADPTYTPPAAVVPPATAPTTAPAPPAPDTPPTISGVSAGGTGTQTGTVSFDMTAGTQTTGVTVKVEAGSFESGVIRQAVDAGNVSAGGGQHFDIGITGLSRSTTYYATIYLNSPAGTVSAQVTFTTPNIDAF
jgi:hypothetical protein